MKLDQLRYFVQIVECHSFNQAAKNLYMTQPALTASMQSLEEELQITLFHRSHKGAYPTKQGLQIYHDCKDILMALEDKMQQWQTLAKPQEKPSGVVHLAAIPVVCNFILEDIIYGIQKQYPEVTIALHEVGMLDFVHEISLGHYNIGLTAVDIAQREQELHRYHHINFQAKVLLADEYYIYLSTKHPYAQKTALSRAEYEELAFITYSFAAETDFTKRFFPTKNIRHLNSLGNILQAVAENKGASIFLHRALENNWYIRNHFICAKPIENKVICPSEYHLIWAEEQTLTCAEKAVVVFIQTHYAEFYGRRL